ncbi:MAG: LrgB family protein [Bacteroidia bacterium]|jgi:predicted murein hydrolase (TIGR00659 family)|nr:LrgB family protein [Bacteroidales bacterium]NCC46311.1 LrgB family protein [Bacteroidia bacterium]
MAMSRIYLEIAFILLTLMAYYFGRAIYRKTKVMVFHTVIVATAVIVLIFEVSGLDMDLYESNTGFLKYVLNLSVVAFGFLLYKHYDFIKSRGLSIITATFIGSLSSILSVVLIAGVLGASPQMIITLLPKSITTPIAIVLAQKTGGIFYLTAVVVTLAGIFGAVTGSWFLKISGIKGRMSRGLAMGSAAHGIGTAKALEEGALEGAAGGLAIALMGIFTSIIAPLFVPLVNYFFGS